MTSLIKWTFQHTVDTAKANCAPLTLSMKQEMISKLESYLLKDMTMSLAIYKLKSEILIYVELDVDPLSLSNDFNIKEFGKTFETNIASVANSILLLTNSSSIDWRLEDSKDLQLLLAETQSLIDNYLSPSTVRPQCSDLIRTNF